MVVRGEFGFAIAVGDPHIWYEMGPAGRVKALGRLSHALLSGCKSGKKGGRGFYSPDEFQVLVAHFSCASPENFSTRYIYKYFRN